MRWTMRERWVLVKSLAARYQKSGKKEKSQLLEEFIEMTGYNRVYGAYLLRQEGRQIRLSPKVVAVADVRPRRPRQRARKYDAEVGEALKQIWQILDYLCGKRLVAILPEVVPLLEKCGELKLSRQTRQRLLEISAATIDRLLAAERRKLQLRGRSGTKPGTLLKSQIPLKRFGAWREDEPGFLEVDLVEHEGGRAREDYL